MRSPLDSLWYTHQPISSSNSNRRTKLFMTPKSKPPPLPQTTDPFLLLGLDPTNPITDPKEIKRAYRKRAMIYHPDVITSADSTEDERRIASENFAKINAAYEMLSGGGNVNNASSSSSQAKSTTAGGYKYQPPHRRSTSYGNKQSTNWEDYMPNYQEEDSKYDADGDSFGSIFSDLLTGVASTAAGVASSSGGRGGIMNDLIEFLESNVDGFSSGYEDDTSLQQLLSTGSFEDVANEMDEMDVLVSSLEKKLSAVENEVMQLEADLGYAIKYSEKIDLEEGIAELKARKKVVSGYLKKGRSRLVRLRERYKELMVQGRGGRGYETTKSEPRSTWRDSYKDSRSPSKPYATTPSASPSTTNPTTSSTNSNTQSKSWRTEGFGGTTRRSSSSRRNSSRRRPRVEPNDAFSGSSYQSSSNQSETTQQPARDYASSRNLDNKHAKPAPTADWAPPHRRAQSRTQQVAEEKSRLRELKVDDEFEKLKREMGQM